MTCGYPYDFGNLHILSKVDGGKLRNMANKWNSTNNKNNNNNSNNNNRNLLDLYCVNLCKLV